MERYQNWSPMASSTGPVLLWTVQWQSIFHPSEKSLSVLCPNSAMVVNTEFHLSLTVSAPSVVSYYSSFIICQTLMANLMRRDASVKYAVMAWILFIITAIQCLSSSVFTDNRPEGTVGGALFPIPPDVYDILEYNLILDVLASGSLPLAAPYLTYQQSKELYSDFHDCLRSCLHDFDRVLVLKVPAYSGYVSKREARSNTVRSILSLASVLVIFRFLSRMSPQEAHVISRHHCQQPESLSPFHFSEAIVGSLVVNEDVFSSFDNSQAVSEISASLLDVIWIAAFYVQKEFPDESSGVRYSVMVAFAVSFELNRVRSERDSLTWALAHGKAAHVAASSVDRWLGYSKRRQSSSW